MQVGFDGADEIGVYYAGIIIARIGPNEEKVQKKEPRKVPQIKVDAKQAAKSLISFRQFVKNSLKQL